MLAERPESCVLSSQMRMRNSCFLLAGFQVRRR